MDIALVQRARTLVLMAGASLLAAGCFSTSDPGPAPLVAAPSAPIERADLAPPIPPPSAPTAPLGSPPPGPLATSADPLAPLGDPYGVPPPASEPLPPLPGETQLAAATPSAPAAPPAPVNVGRTDLLGRWTISANGESCDIYMSLTTWTGGYRASTRGCNSPSLANISAWDLSGRTVTLKGGDGGGSVASLTATDGQRFSGSTADGAGITVSR